MNARAKIEWLTNSWYGLALFGGLLSLWENGIGLWGLFLAGGSTVFSLFVTFLIGKALLGKSSLTRSVVIVLAGIGFLFCSLAVGKQVLGFFMGPISAVLWGVFYGATAVMHLRSIRTLTDKSVKAYFS